MHKDSVVLESVSKVFRNRPALFNWMGKERCDSTPALTNINLSVPSAHVLVLLGPNGSGKTTTLKLVSTMLLPDAGRVLVHGSDTSKDPQAVRRRVGFSVATERSFFPRLSHGRTLTSSPCLRMFLEISASKECKPCSIKPDYSRLPIPW